MAKRSIVALSIALLVLAPVVLASITATACGPRWASMNTTRTPLGMCYCPHPWSWPRAGVWSTASEVTVTGKLVGKIPPRILILDVNGSKTYVVLPLMLVTSSNSLTTSEKLVESLQEGVTVTVKGLARTHPLLQSTIIRALEVTVNNTTYLWPPLLLSQLVG